MKFTTLWEFKDAQHKKEIETSALASIAFIQSYIKYLEKKKDSLYNQIVSRSLFDNPDFKDKLSSVVGELRAYDEQIDALNKLFELQKSS
jgi:hypothetical protein